MCRARRCSLQSVIHLCGECMSPLRQCCSCNMDFGTHEQKYCIRTPGRVHAREVWEQAGLREKRGNILLRMQKVTATSKEV